MLPSGSLRAVVLPVHSGPLPGRRWVKPAAVLGMWDDMGLGQEGAGIYLGQHRCAQKPGVSVSKEKPPRSEPRAKLKGSVDKPAGVGVGGRGEGQAVQQKHPCALPEEHCLCYFPLGRHWETGRTVLDDPIIH